MNYGDNPIFVEKLQLKLLTEESIHCVVPFKIIPTKEHLKKYIFENSVIY